MTEEVDGYKSLLFIGLPGSGKSTFLGALAGCVEHADYEGSYSFGGYPEERALLEQLIDDWLQCNTVQRTKGQEPFANTLHLANKESGNTIVLDLPDLSGEIFDRQCERRNCSAEYVSMVESTNQVLLFCHAGKNYRNEPIPKIVGITDEEVDEEVKELEVKWNPNHLSLGGKLVDILQMLLEIRGEVPGKLKIAVVISAWDLVMGLQPVIKLTPSEFLDKNVSLLSQFLASQSAKIDYEIFGVSAQGGDYENGGAKNELLKMSPLGRISVANGEAISKDIALPVKWLIG